MADQTRAVLLFESKRVLRDGYILQARIWEVREPVLPSFHRFKYSLYFGRAGRREVSYDNERGKGDHRHYNSEELAYRFESVEKLVADFLADVARVYGHPLVFEDRKE